MKNGNSRIRFSTGDNIIVHMEYESEEEVHWGILVLELIETMVYTAMELITSSRMENDFY